MTRFVFLRGLGFVYFFAFLSAALQIVPLYGESGLLPADLFLQKRSDSSPLHGFLAWPTLFHFYLSDTAMVILAWMGCALSLIVLAGFANMIILFLLWLFYMSIVHIGQLFYGFGWEMQTLELGFLAIWMVPFRDWRPFPKSAVPLPTIWLLRWFLFRFYMGSGLIKLRGSECWDDFTCLFYHFETQPIPNPLSPFMHYLPKFILKFGVMFTEFLQVIAAFFVFYPRKLRIAAGCIFFTFQSILILTGNYSFFNWITWVPALALFDDRFLGRILPRRLVAAAERAEENKVEHKITYNNVIYAVFGGLLVLSAPVVANLISNDQVMNRSFNQWKLVNTYGAFGYVGKVRYELEVSGTTDRVINDESEWRAYEFYGKPTDISAGLPVLAPYQPRIDWQIWFAAQSTSAQHGWLLHLIWKFLHNDENALSLIRHNPFPDKPPTFIKVDRYIYEFEPPLSENTWRRKYHDSWMTPLHQSNQSLVSFIRKSGWEMYE
ncbi:MAG: lipase maturation factor family protein [Pseudomonadota bacterium]